LSISLAVQAFVPKPGTQLENEKMAEIPLIKHRLDLLRRLISGRVRMMPTSPRLSWLDWKLAHAAERASLAAIIAHKKGSTFEAWRQAIDELGL
jgi:radical SAM superfamily enzyme YgiQ (UPF0313 family)